MLHSYLGPIAKVFPAVTKEILLFENQDKRDSPFRPISLAPCCKMTKETYLKPYQYELQLAYLAS